MSGNVGLATMKPLPPSDGWACRRTHVGRIDTSLRFGNWRSATGTNVDP
jgi:hypothetical protein